MKKMTILSLLLILSANLFSQQTTSSPTFNKQDYLQKSKNQKTAAWVLLGGGIVLMGSGFLIGDRKESSFSDAGTGVVIGGIGFLATIGSIPLFITSSKNKRRGMNATANLIMEDLSGGRKYSLYHSSYPALTVKLKL